MTERPAPAPRAIAALAGLGLLAACGSGSIADRERPDEFAVGRAQPLVIPPDFTLVPPRPGEPRPVEVDTRTQVLEALFGPGVRLPPRSDIENRLLERARASQADPMIRSNAADLAGVRTAAGVDKGAFLREILDSPPGTRNEQIARVIVGG